MLFPSFVFLFVFLPLALLGFDGAGRRFGPRAALAWLLGAAIVFYGWSNPRYVALLAGIVAFNYALALGPLTSKRWGRATLWAAVSVNLAILGWFKYASFVVANWNEVTGASVAVGAIALPLGISFITFSQIGYLADTARGVNRDRDLLRYAVFSSFFPTLIAGPILHARELIPQVAKSGFGRVETNNLAIGGTLFAFGLAKKVLLADALAPHVDALFGASASRLALTPFEAWAAAFGATIQLYFDFSGYSDMAIGIARMFGILLPENFFSPFKATSIADFWNRWHITLSRFLRDRIYLAMTLRKGKPRPGPARRWSALFVTMALGGLWHGAGWTYVAWGAMHGAMLVVHDAWRLQRAKLGRLPLAGTPAGRSVARAITFFGVVVSMILFRAVDARSAGAVLASFFGIAGRAVVPQPGTLVAWTSFLPLLGVALAVTFFTPSSQEILRRYSPSFYRAAAPAADSPGPRLEWSPSLPWAVAVASAWLFAVLHFNRVATFIYFQF